MTNHYSSMPAPHKNRGAATLNLLRLPALMVLMLLLIVGKGWGQTDVFYDDFNRALVSPGGTPSLDYAATNTGSGTEVIESTLVTGTVPYLKISNGSTLNGRSYLTGPLSSFSTPFSPTLSANPGVVAWSFNARHNRNSTMSGFDAGNYGYALVLVASSGDLSTANGYAVVSGGSGSNVYRLVKFTGGLYANSKVTNLVTGLTQADRRDYMSVKVTYDPLSGTWSYYDRTDGPSATPSWADPSAGSYTLRGTSTDASFTSTPMTHFGYLWNYTASATATNGYFDNFKVSVTPILTPTLSVAPSSLTGFNYFGAGPSDSQSFNISGVNLTGSTVTVTGSTNYEVATDLNPTFAGSVNIPYTAPTLASTAIHVRLKAGLGVGNYNSGIIGNAGGGVGTSVDVTCSGFVLGEPVTYTWTGATNNDWQVAANWSPARTTSVINDILKFNNGSVYTIINVPTQTIAQLLVSGGSKITLQAAAIATLTIAGTTGDDLTVSGSGSELNVLGANALSFTLNTGTNGFVNGSMTLSGAAHTVKSADANSLVFTPGSVFKATTGFLGNVFGTTNINSIKFQSGSTYIQDAGSNPFGANQPSSVVTFETGSLYKFTATIGGPSYSGRTYANFENDSPTITQNNQGSSPFTCDNYTVTSGIVNWDFTGGIFVKGNISVSSAATLIFGKVTKVTNLTLSGTSEQTISGTGFMDFGALGTLIVNNPAGATLNTNATLFNLTVTSGIFKVVSGASLITSGTVTGNVTVERTFASGSDAWHLFCLPTSSGFNASPLFDGAYVDAYSENTGAWNRLLTANSIDPKTGYSVNFPSGSHTLAFSGAVNTGDQSFSGLSYTTGAPGYGAGWHLLGNPFPSAVDLDLGTWTKTNLDGYVYVWDGAQYVCGPTSTGGLSTLTDNVIPAMQGFFVKASSDAAGIVIPQASRVHSSTFYKNAQLSANAIYLSINGNGYEDKAIVAFNPLSTAGFDSDYDAYKLFGKTEAPQLYSILPTEKATVNTLPSYTSNELVPLGLKVGAATSYTLTAEGMDSFDPALPIRLDDLKLGTSMDLRLNPVYSFTSAPGDTENRFRLRFASATGVDEQSALGLHTWATNGEIHIILDAPSTGKAFLYNVAGQLVATAPLNSGETLLSTNASGVYIVKVITGRTTTTQKVVVTQL